MTDTPPDLEAIAARAQELEEAAAYGPDINRIADVGALFARAAKDLVTLLDRIRDEQKRADGYLALGTKDVKRAIAAEARVKELEQENKRLSKGHDDIDKATAVLWDDTIAERDAALARAEAAETALWLEAEKNWHAEVTIDRLRKGKPEPQLRRDYERAKADRDKSEAALARANAVIRAARQSRRVSPQPEGTER